VRRQGRGPPNRRENQNAQPTSHLAFFLLIKLLEAITFLSPTLGERFAQITGLQALRNLLWRMETGDPDHASRSPPTIIRRHDTSANGATLPVAPRPIRPKGMKSESSWIYGRREAATSMEPVRTCPSTYCVALFRHSASTAGGKASRCVRNVTSVQIFSSDGSLPEASLRKAPFITNIPEYRTPCSAIQKS